MTRKFFSSFFVATTFLGLVIAKSETTSTVRSAESAYHFDVIGLFEPVEHTFEFLNEGLEVLEVTNVVMTSPIHLKSADSKIAPGEEGKVSFYLGTPRIAGDYDGAIRVEFKNPGIEPVVFSFQGKLTPAIECKPMPAFYVATTRNQEKTSTLEIINRDGEPLKLSRVNADSERFATRLETIEEGQRYKLHLTASGKGEAGPVAEKIVFSTSSAKQPTLSIVANTLIKERVHTFPKEVDFGALPYSDVTNTALVEVFSQTLMVYRESDPVPFKVTAESDLDFVKLNLESSEAKDCFKITVQLRSDKIDVGPFSGTIRIKTNDPEFAELIVPIRGGVQAVN